MIANHQPATDSPEIEMKIVTADRHGTSFLGLHRSKSALIFLCCACLGGCGVAAAPCRVVSAGLKAIPAIGHPMAAPTDACADAIDPDSKSQESDDTNQKPSDQAGQQ